MTIPPQSLHRARVPRAIKPKMSPVQPDQIDIQIGIYEGCEWDYTEIAEHVGRTTEALRLRRTGAKKVFIDQISAFVQLGIERKLKPRLAAADVKRRISEKAWRNLELLLERTEQTDTGDKPIVDALLLAAVKEALDRTEGKSLDRKAIQSEHQENINVTVTHQIDGQAIDSIADEATRITEMRRRLLPASSHTMQVQEAQLIEPAN